MTHGRARTQQGDCPRNKTSLACLWGVLLLALLVRGAVWSQHADLLLEDRDAYAEIARNVVSGRGYSMGQPPHPTAYRPPLYPICLAAIFALGGSEATVGAWQLALGLATVAMTFCIARRLTSWPLGAFAGALVAVDPLLAQNTWLIMTETLAAFLATLWIEVETRSHTAKRQSREQHDDPPETLRVIVPKVLSGAVLGFCCLCRPTFLLLAMCWLCGLSFGVVRHRKTPRQSAKLWGLAAFVMSLAAVLAPWTLRNALVIGFATPATTHSGYTLLLANNPTFFEEVVRQRWGTTWRGESLRDWQARLERDMAAAKPPVTKERSRNRWMTARAWKYIREQPGMFLWACGWRFLRFWDVVPHGASYAALPAWGFFGIGGVYLFCIAGALWGTFVAWRDWTAWVPAITCLMCIQLTHCIYWSDMRMRAPVIPIIAILAAAGWSDLVRRGPAIALGRPRTSAGLSAV